MAPDNLEAWSLYHLGLQPGPVQPQDNLAAQAHFEHAIAKEPRRFARAHARPVIEHGSQSAFLRYSDNPARDVEEARRFGEPVEFDPLDPFANFAMGRTFWLRGNVEDSWPWLDRSAALCPNYA